MYVGAKEYRQVTTEFQGSGIAAGALHLWYVECAEAGSATPRACPQAQHLRMDGFYTFARRPHSRHSVPNASKTRSLPDQVRQ